MNSKGQVSTEYLVILAVVLVVALVVVIAVFLFAGTDRKITHVALALFAAGVSGNLYDRLFNDGSELSGGIDRPRLDNTTGNSITVGFFTVFPD